MSLDHGFNSPIAVLSYHRVGGMCSTEVSCKICSAAVPIGVTKKSIMCLHAHARARTPTSTHGLVVAILIYTEIFANQLQYKFLMF